jgi:putative transcriptional regulator
MSKQDFLTGHFLIAMPTLGDPNFHHSVTLICEHTDAGALGIVVNRPMEDLHLGDVLEQLELKNVPDAVGGRPLYSGGPVERERGFVIHRPASDWEATLKLDGDIGITSSRDILAAMAAGEGPAESLVALGYAGWGAGQLEREMSENAWLSSRADARILFEVAAEHRWREAARAMGVDISRLSGESGRA